MRKGEASLLRWEMVQGNELQIPATICKNGMARTIPLDGERAEIIERRRQVRTVEVNGTAQMCPLIFHRGGESTGEFKKSWKTACKKSELPWSPSARPSPVRCEKSLARPGADSGCEIMEWA